MKIRIIIIFIILHILFPRSLLSQTFEYMGLASEEITSLNVNDYKIAVGTNRRGVFWKPDILPHDSTWNHISLDSLFVTAVYPHKSGPIGWAIGAGVLPRLNDTVFVYCSHMGESFLPKSFGISSAYTDRIVKLDGYPDPTICGETYAAGGKALYRRYWADTVWTPIYITTAEGHLNSVRVRESYRGVVIAGGGDESLQGFLIKSTDFGDSWMDISPSEMVFDVDFAGESGETIIVAAHTNIYKSIDGGLHWISMFQCPELYTIPEVVYDGVNKAIFAICESITSPDIMSLLIYSMNDGQNWYQIPLENWGPIVDVELSENRERSVYFAARDAGVYRFTLQTAVEDKKHNLLSSSGFQLNQNYPNPFNLFTRIEYQLSQSTFVELSIFDIQGRKVKNLMNKIQFWGRHEVLWDGTDSMGKQVASGIYFYKLQADTHIKVRKMLVEK